MQLYQMESYVKSRVIKNNKLLLNMKINNNQLMHVFIRLKGIYNSL